MIKETLQYVVFVQAKGGDAPAAVLEAASLEELHQKIITLEKEKNKEEEYRNYMQLERVPFQPTDVCVSSIAHWCSQPVRVHSWIQDKINAFWEISKKDLDDRKAELRNKDREMEEMEERHQVEIKVYKQKVKHLLYEHQNTLALQKVDTEYALKLQHEDFQAREDELDRDKRRLKHEVKEHEFADQQHVLEMQRDHAKEITKLRQAFELQVPTLFVFTSVCRYMMCPTCNVVCTHRPENCKASTRSK